MNTDSGKQSFTITQPNAGQPPIAPNQININSPNVTQQFRPRMDYLTSNERSEPLNQQIMQQQRNQQPNYQQMPRFPGGENPVRIPFNPSNGGVIRLNDPDQNFAKYQKSLGEFPQGPRMQTGPQIRVPGPQLQMRPPTNDFNFPTSNQPRPLNVQHVNSPRPQSFPIPPNQTLPINENYQRQIVRDQPPAISRKNSNLDLNASNNFPKIIRHESKSQLEIKPGDSVQNIQHSKTEKDRSADDLGNQKDSDSRSEVIQNFSKSDKNLKEIIRKETKEGERVGGDIKSGIVLRNIKFFESNDVAKTPLIPQEIGVKKKENKITSPPNLIKRESDEKYESGVDETPVVHPNLGSIFETPRKVAKIPYRKIKKNFGKPKSEKKSRPPFQVLFKSRQGSEKPKTKRGYTRSLNKTESSKKGTKNFGPDEELLAFFESSNSWRKLKRYGISKVDHSAAKGKLENKPKANGDIESPKKTPSKLPAPSKKNQPVSPARTPLKSPGTPGAISLPKTPDSPAPSTPLIKKVPMNKIQVGAAPSPNLKTVKSKIGSLANTTHKPGGGNVKIESHKIDLSNAQSRIEAKNDQYKRQGGDKKIPQMKLEWSAKSKIGSLENATYKPGGGDKKIESVKLDFKEKAKPKVGSKDNVKHVPGGGNVKIENQKLEFKAQSKVGSLDNVKHKPGGGEVKIFDDKTYLRQISGTSSEGRVSGTQSYGDLSVIKEKEGRSTPENPGHETSVKIKKKTTIYSNVGAPTLKNVTEIPATPRTPKKERDINKSRSEQQITHIYSKFSEYSKIDPKSPEKTIKTKAKNHAPAFKSDLSEKDACGTGDINGKKEKGEIHNANKYLENFKQSFESSSSYLKNNGKMARDSLDYSPTQENIGEVLMGRNTTENTSYERAQDLKLSPEISSSVDSRPLESQVLNNFQKIADDPRKPNNYFQQNYPSQKIYQPTPFSQSQQQFPSAQK